MVGATWALHLGQFRRWRARNWVLVRVLNSQNRGVDIGVDRIDITEYRGIVGRILIWARLGVVQVKQEKTRRAAIGGPQRCNIAISECPFWDLSGP